MKNEKATGLSQEEVRKRLFAYGRNSIEVQRKTFVVTLFLSQYKSIITVILAVAAAFSFYIHEFVDVIFILSILVFNGLFGFFQEFKAEKTLEKLKEYTIPTASVVRSGVEQEVGTDEIVPGDIVLLREGDQIPADGVLSSNIPLEVDESVFTGESMQVEKKPQDQLFAGTFVMRGRGTLEVLQTGFQTRFGKIAKEMGSIKKSKTPLSENLERLGKWIAVVAIIISVLIVPIGLLQHLQIKELFLTSISLAVAIIPEGLPLVLTIALAVGGYRMASQHTIVRKLTAIETLGSTNVILTDKTGTLTQNKMSVKKYWLPDESKKDFLFRAAILGNTASLALAEDTKKFEVVGDKTDGALLQFVAKDISDLEAFRKVGRVLEESPFDSVTKTIEIEWSNGSETFEFVRGAPEIVVERADHMRDEEKKAIQVKIDEFAKEALRVIGFSYRKKNDASFTFLGLVGIYDPPRIEARDTIQKARVAGIQVVMVTGDNPTTALAIAEEVGLIQKEEVVLTSDEIRRMSDEELIREFRRVRVYARMQPEDKLRLVRLYKRAGSVVAVTGDGVNDALALAESHIGVAMGEEGTDVAKEASDIVITDDNLATIIKAVEEGRNIFNNLTKVVVYLFSSNTAEFLVIFLVLVFGLPILFSPSQILWINLISDGFPALALASDNRRRGLLFLKPRARSEQIINTKRLVSIGIIAAVITIATFFLYVVLLQFMPVYSARIIVFDVFVLLEFLLVFIIRGGLFPLNHFMIVSVAVSYLLQIALLLSPLVSEIFP